MCAIFGVVDFANVVYSELYKSCFDNMRHRGPDASALVALEDFAVFGHHRLSILDNYSRSNQPMISNCGRYAIVYNGEIYNYKDIRKIYIDQYSFKTESDTEVILAGYAIDGLNILNLIDGMFAFAILDKVEMRIVLARDPAGQKPLYYKIDGTRLIFASEIQGIEHANAELDVESIRRFISSSYFFPTETPYMNIRKVEPGTALIYDRYGISQHPYFVRSSYVNSYGLVTEAESLESLDSIIKTQVEKSVPDDVDYCLYLSGGIDSSLILAYLNELGHAPNTFSLIMPDDSYSERDSIATLLNYKKANHINILFSHTDFVDAFIKVTANMDEPNGDIGYINSYFISNYVRERGIKVALTGDGGDELFRGYITYLASKYTWMYNSIFIGGIVRGVSSLIPRSNKYMSFSTKLDYFQRGFDLPDCLLPYALLSTLQPRVHGSLYVDKTSFSDLYGRYALGALSFENMLDDFYWNPFLSEHTCAHADRAAMRCGVETRAPFLNHELIKASNNIPGFLKIKSGHTKYILRKLAERKGIPKSIAFGKKRGFSYPSKSIFRGKLRGVMEGEILSSSVLFDKIGFNRAAVEKILSDFYINNAENTRLIYNIYLCAKLLNENKNQVI